MSYQALTTGSIDLVFHLKFFLIKYLREFLFLGVVKHDSKIGKSSLFLEDTKPLVINRETSVMTFTDYFCYIGVLFRISANQLFEKLIENYRGFTHSKLILFYTLLEIMNFIKAEFQSIKSYFYCSNKISFTITTILFIINTYYLLLEIKFLFCLVNKFD